jgi:hypothetical protein
VPAEHLTLPAEPAKGAARAVNPSFCLARNLLQSKDTVDDPQLPLYDVDEVRKNLLILF